MCMYGRATAYRSDEHEDAHEHREHQRLVEHEIRALMLLRADRVRHHRRRADVQDLREREHDEPEIARDAEARRHFVAEHGDELEVGDEIRHLHDHADEHLDRHRRDVSRDRTNAQVFHAGTKGGGLNDRPELNRQLPREPKEKAGRETGLLHQVSVDR